MQMQMHGFDVVCNVVQKPGQKQVRDWYTGNLYYVNEPYLSKISLAQRFTKGENVDEGTWGYSRKYDESIVYKALNDSYITRSALEESRPTWLQHARLNIRDAVYLASGDGESPCVPGTLDGMFWLGHVYVQFKDVYTSVPYAMALGILPKDATDDDSHGWYDGIVRLIMRAVWEGRAEGLKPSALDTLAEYCGCMYALMHHCATRATRKNEIDTDMAMAMFNSYYNHLIGKTRNAWSVKYYNKGV